MFHNRLKVKAMAEIKISELSIGDWVRYESTVRTVPMKVLEIGEKYTMCDGQIYITGETEGGRMFCEITELKPILLTPEILEKNGFDAPKAKVWNDSWYWSNRKDVALELRESFGLWYMEIVTKEQRSGLQSNRKLGFGFKYVHQLQHALRLAGVERMLCYE